MKNNKIFKKNKDVVTRVIQDETVLVPIYKSSEDINCIYTLNKPASSVWQMINGKRSLGTIMKRLLKDFDSTPAEIEKELDELIKDFKEIKAIQ